MGKNSTRESLAREMTNVVVHEILTVHTNRPEAVPSVKSEAIEYRSNAEKILKKFNWNADDKSYIKNKALKMIKEKMASKYPDVKYSEQEAINRLKKIIEEIM